MNSITTLRGVTTGTYLISTNSGARYILNLDRTTICRIAPPRSESAETLRQDGDEIDVVEMGDFEVGQTVLFVVNLHIPGVVSTIRRSTRVLAIENIAFEAQAPGGLNE
jgi:hypothetical protein